MNLYESVNEQLVIREPLTEEAVLEQLKQYGSISVECTSKGNVVLNKGLVGTASIKSEDEVFVYLGDNSGINDFVYVSDGQASALDRLLSNFDIREVS